MYLGFFSLPVWMIFLQVEFFLVFGKGLDCNLKTIRTKYKQAKFSRRSSNQFRNSTERNVAESKPKYEHTEKFPVLTADKPAKA